MLKGESDREIKRTRRRVKCCSSENIVPSLCHGLLCPNSLALRLHLSGELVDISWDSLYKKKKRLIFPLLTSSSTDTDKCVMSCPQPKYVHFRCPRPACFLRFDDKRACAKNKTDYRQYNYLFPVSPLSIILKGKIQLTPLHHLT